MAQQNQPVRTPTEKFLGFQHAFKTFSAHLKSGNVIAAYVVGFSVFEDRVSACFAMAKDAAKQQRPNGHPGLANKINFLARQGLIDAVVQNDWLAAAYQRNELVHAAMWNVDAFHIVHAEKAVTCAREADKVCKRIKRMK